MKRIWGHVVSVVGVCVVASAAVPACATNDQSIFIRAVLAPSTNRQNNVCVYTDDPSQPQLIAGGVLDVGIRDNYVGILLVGNQLVSRGDPINNVSESSRVHVEGAVVTVTDANGGVINEFTSPATGFADPQSSNTPDYAVVGATLIDAATKNTVIKSLPDATVAVTVIAEVKVFGTTLGGTDLESGTFKFPIKVCNGCLVDFSTGNDVTQQPQLNCLKPLDASSGGGTQVIPCAAGQDESTPCQLCLGRAVCNSRTL